MVLEDLIVVVPSFGDGAATKRVLNGLSGYAEHGGLMVVIGPFGFRKSTLLDLLAGLFSFSLFHLPTA